MFNQEYKKITRDIAEKYTRTNYRIIGKNKHTSIKPCHWLEQKLLTGRNNRNCYKGYFGIQSETCIQNSPSYAFCNHNCGFCWRDTSGNFDTQFSVKPDEPEYLISELIRHQQNFVEYTYALEKNLQNFDVMVDLLNEYHKDIKFCLPCQQQDGRYPLFNIVEISKRINKSRSIVTKAIILLKSLEILRSDDLKYYYLDKNIFDLLKQNGGNSEQVLDQFVTNPEDIKNVHKSAMNPRHAAISLDGEPTLYPFIGEYVNEFRKRKFTTFIVTNGTNPHIIQKLSDNGNLPTQLYMTLPPPDINNYKMICKPRLNGLWDNINRTLSMLSDLKSRTVLRITSLKNLNIKDEMIEGYIERIQLARPDFLDIKGFTLEGASMNISDRIGSKEPGSYYFPSFDDLMNFAKKISSKSGFEIIETHKKSRDILLRVAWPKDKDIKITSDQI
jgi:wyosine [tRNA(Phe)-imidazoG37] synthetase (radical SAM superfamily)